MQTINCEREPNNTRESKMLSHYNTFIKESIFIKPPTNQENEINTLENKKTEEEDKSHKVIRMSKYRYLFEDSKLGNSHPLIV